MSGSETLALNSLLVLQGWVPRPLSFWLLKECSGQGTASQAPRGQQPAPPCTLEMLLLGLDGKGVHPLVFGKACSSFSSEDPCPRHEGFLGVSKQCMHVVAIRKLQVMDLEAHRQTRLLSAAPPLVSHVLPPCPKLQDMRKGVTRVKSCIGGGQVR